MVGSGHTNNEIVSGYYYDAETVFKGKCLFYFIGSEPHSFVLKRSIKNRNMMKKKG